MSKFLIGRRDLADRLNVSVATVDRIVKAGQGPRVTRISDRRVLFLETDVTAWLARRAGKSNQPSASKHAEPVAAA